MGNELVRPLIVMGFSSLKLFSKSSILAKAAMTP